MKPNTKEEWEKAALGFLKDEANRINVQLSQEGEFDFLNLVEKQEIERSNFITRYRSVPVGCESFFVVLRKWNSYTPSLPIQSEREAEFNQFSIGGGYYLYIQGPENKISSGYGLVIDPGYNFIHNFGLAGFCLDDIDGVLITHAHNDHTNDFESLLSLLYQRNSKYLGRRKPKKVDLFLNVGSFKKFSNYLDLSKTKKDTKNYIGKVNVLSPGQAVNLPNIPENTEAAQCSILSLYTEHHEIITADYSLGICFKLLDRNIFLTGDTGWKFDTTKRNEEFLSEHGIKPKDESASGNIDILISHIGSIKRSEFTDHEFYSSHLGLLGTIATVERWKPGIVIISEFGEELSGIREKLVRELDVTCKKINTEIKCLPGDIGLFLLVDSRQALCYVTGSPMLWNEISYKDVTDKPSLQSIKYFSEAELNNIREQEREKFLRDINISNGLKDYKKYYLTQIVGKGFDLRNLSEEQLIDELSNISIDYTDPWESEEKELEVVGRLFALSCILDDPVKVVEAFKNGKNGILLAEFLKIYGIDVDIFWNLALFAYSNGYDNSEDEKPLLDQLVQSEGRKIIGEYVNAFKQPDIESEKSIFEKLKVLSVDSLSEKLIPEVIIEYTYNNKGKNDISDSNKQFDVIAVYIQKYLTLKSTIEEVIRDNFKKCTEGQERCWQAAYWPISVELLQREHEEESDIEKKALKKEILEKSKEIEAIIDKAAAIAESFKSLISDKGLKPHYVSNKEINLFIALYYILKEIEKKSIDGDILKDLHSIIKQTE